MVIIKIKGGLGNQLFQYATAFSIAKKYNQPVLLDTSFFDNPKYKDIFRLNDFLLEYVIDKSLFNCYENKTNYFSKIYNKLYYNYNIVNQPIGNYINAEQLISLNKIATLVKAQDKFLLEGWFQKLFFFEDIIPELSLLFLPNKSNGFDMHIENSIINTNSVCIHVRRGDMEKNNYFNVLRENYYRLAVEIINKKIENPHFFVFSDEPDKAKSLLTFVKQPIFFIEKNALPLEGFSTKYDFIDFYWMRLCKHHIIANSTFSWWPAYLSNTIDHNVVCPKYWFQKKIITDLVNANYNIISNWNIIENE